MRCLFFLDDLLFPNNFEKINIWAALKDFILSENTYLMIRNGIAIKDPNQYEISQREAKEITNSFKSNFTKIGVHYYGTSRESVELEYPLISAKISSTNNEASIVELISIKCSDRLAREIANIAIFYLASQLFETYKNIKDLKIPFRLINQDHYKYGINFSNGYTHITSIHYPIKNVHNFTEFTQPYKALRKIIEPDPVFKFNWPSNEIINM